MKKTTEPFDNKQIILQSINDMTYVRKQSKKQFCTRTIQPEIFYVQKEMTPVFVI